MMYAGRERENTLGDGVRRYIFRFNKRVSARARVLVANGAFRKSTREETAGHKIGGLIREVDADTRG